MLKLTLHNTQYSKLGLSWLRQYFVSNSASLSVDKNAFQNPQLFIPPTLAIIKKRHKTNK